jgi:CCR4-NOT transcription complex subunit 4
VLGSKKTATSSGSEAKKNIKALAIESGLSGNIASQASKAKSKSNTVLQDEDFPALDTPKTNPVSVATPGVQSRPLAAKSVAAGKKVADKKISEKQTAKEKDKGKSQEKGSDNNDKAVVVAAEAPPSSSTEATKTTTKPSDKRPVIGTLNIAAATKASQTKAVVDGPRTTENLKSASEKDSAFPALPTPSTASVLSPVTRTAPKTLRVVPTPKTEVPPPTLPGSVRSATSVVRPETPGSEIISDSASIISAGVTLSRASSPPPSRVGTAPLRTATKSQQRKARKEAVKKDTEAIATQPKPEPEVDIAPIVGRKKKQKKEKAATSSNATPTESRPETPVTQQPATSLVKEVKEMKEVKDDSSAYRSTAHETMSLTEDKPPVRMDAKGKGKDMSEPGPGADPSSARRLPAALPTPSSTFQQLLEEGAFLGGLESLSFVKPVAGLADKHRHDPPSTSLVTRGPGSDIIEPHAKSIVNEEDQEALLEGRAVRKFVDGVRVMLTPYGDCVRNLSPEEENRFLELQERVAEVAASPAAFISTHHEPAGGFSLIRGRAVPNGPPGYFPQAPGAYPQDPVNKIQREEAIYYINQYVLPRIALGASGFPGSWKAAFPDGKANLNAAAMTDKIAANLHTAASEFNSTMAPYMDTVAPELSYPAPADVSSPHHHHHHNHHSQNIASVLVNSFGSSPWADHASGAAGPSGLGNFSGPPASGGPFPSLPLMSLEEAEYALADARKETEKLEKSLNQVIKKNRKLLSLHNNNNGGGGFGAGGAGTGTGISAH